MTSPLWIRYGFICSGLINVLGIPIFSKFFTNTYLMGIDPNTFSAISLVTIILWGLAYISVAKQVAKVPLIALVFTIEKFFYAIVWGRWIWRHHTELAEIYAQDMVTGFFYSVYGLNDFLIGVFFLAAFMHIRSLDNNIQETM